MIFVKLENFSKKDSIIILEAVIRDNTNGVFFGTGTKILGDLLLANGIRYVSNALLANYITFI